MSEVFFTDESVIFSLVEPVGDAILPFEVERIVVSGENLKKFELNGRPFCDNELVRFIYTGQPFAHVIESFRRLTPEKEAEWINDRKNRFETEFDIKDPKELPYIGKDQIRIEFFRLLKLREGYQKMDLINEPLLLSSLGITIRHEGDNGFWQFPGSSLAEYRLFD